MSDTIKPIKKIYTQYGISEQKIKHSDNITGQTYIMGGSIGLDEPENQDAYSITRVLFESKIYDIIIGCDGHGTYGKLYSTHTVTNFIQHVLDNFEYILDNSLVLKKLFTQFNSILYYKFNMFNGGTTITLCIKTNDRIIVANLGDFDVVSLIQTDPSNISISIDGIKKQVISNIITLTGNHSGTSDIEVQRVIEAGCSATYNTNYYYAKKIDVGYIKEINGKKQFIRNKHKLQKDGYYINMNNDPSIYFSDNLININMSRSFGDFGIKFIIDEPSITDITLPIKTLSKIILGSDGYFNCFTTKEINEQLLLSSDEICQNSLIKVELIFGSSIADNMTVIVLE